MELILYIAGGFMWPVGWDNMSQRLEWARGPERTEILRSWKGGEGDCEQKGGGPQAALPASCSEPVGGCYLALHPASHKFSLGPHVSSCSATGSCRKGWGSLWGGQTGPGTFQLQSPPGASSGPVLGLCPGQ